MQMITKVVVKDYVAKKCAYLTKSELNDKTLLELVKKSIPYLNDLQSDLAMDKEEGEENDGEADSGCILNLTSLSRDYPHLRSQINKILEEIPKNAVEAIVEKYKDEQLTADLSRKYVEQLYKGYKCVRCDIDGDGNPIINQGLIVKTTEDALKDKSNKVIFEGQIEYRNYRARFDVLIRNDDGSFDLFEVKGTNNVCERSQDKSYETKIKDKYLYDLLFQYYVYSKAGYSFNEIGYITTNENYTLKTLSYPTDDSDLINLFKFKNEINLKEDHCRIKYYFDEGMYYKKKRSTQEDIEMILARINEIDKCEISAPAMLPECKKTPACPFLTVCFKHALDLDSIYKLTKWNLFGGNYLRSNELIRDGIKYIKDIDDSYVDEKFPLNKKTEKIEGNKKNCARLQIDLEKGLYKTKYVIDKSIIGKLLHKDYTNDGINYLVFFDFESFQHPIPLVKDSHPWKQVVSQYSMHVCKKNYDLSKHDFDAGHGGGIDHFEFIGNPDVDGFENPSFKLYDTLKQQMESIGIDIYGSDYRVIVFNRNFEKSRMSEFTRDFGDRIDPDLKKFVDNFNLNVVDLLDFFTEGSIYSRDFGGRGSLKVVQPGLTTDPDVLKYYKSLNLPFDFEYSLDYHKGDKCLVYNGAICLDLFKSLIIRKHMGEQNKGLPTKDLLAEALAYCKIDSWGTVILYDIIKNIYDGFIQLDATYIG